VKQLETIVEKTRIIYEIKANSVFVIAIFDGRQNVQAHLLQRMQKSH
jgi:plasmid stabilization system protein ParE